jgi:hypothetical protein
MNRLILTSNRELSISVPTFGNNRKMAKYRQTKTKTKPLTYEQQLKPQHINRLKTYHSINTNTLQGMGHELHGDNHSGNALYEDLFIRKFVQGVYFRQMIPEKGIGVLRRLNEIEVVITITLVSSFIIPIARLLNAIHVLSFLAASLLPTTEIEKIRVHETN